MQTEKFSSQLSPAVIDAVIKNYNLVNPPEAADIAEADMILADQDINGSFKSVRYDDITFGNWAGMKHWLNLHTLTGAWHATGEEKYCSAIIAGLEFWADELPENRNWWWQFVGVPQNAIRVMNNMYGKIPQKTWEKMRNIFDRSDIISVRNLIGYDRIDENFYPDRIALIELTKNKHEKIYNCPKVKFTGQNLVSTGTVRMWKGIFFNDMELLRSGMEEVFSEAIMVGVHQREICEVPEVDRFWMNPGFEGIQTDYSYHQHGAQLQFGSYGSHFLIDMLRTVKIFSQEEFAPPAEKVELLRNYFTEGLRWTLYKKQLDILACGRQTFKDAPYVKYDNIAEVINSCDEALQMPLQETFENLTGSKYFYRSDYFIHRAKERFFSFKMSSSRVFGGESTNNENLQGLYLGCGTMQYKITGNEYDLMPALWDGRRLPGLTALFDDASLRARSNTNTSPTVGGVSDGSNSGVMMHLAHDEKIEFFKSVSTFGDTILFALSDVVNKTDFPVNTTIDSKRYTTPVEVLINGKKQLFSEGSHNLTEVGRIVCGETAYTFPEAADLTLVIEEKEVQWNTVASWADGSCRGKIVTFYISGNKPLSYFVHPAGQAPDGIKCEIKEKFYHAAIDKKSNTKYIFFFVPGNADIPGIGKVFCDSPAAVMITQNNVLLANVEQSGATVKFILDGKEYNFTDGENLYRGMTSSLSR